MLVEGLARKRGRPGPDAKDRKIAELEADNERLRRSMVAPFIPASARPKSTRKVTGIPVNGSDVGNDGTTVIEGTFEGAWQWWDLTPTFEENIRLYLTVAAEADRLGAICGPLTRN